MMAAVEAELASAYAGRSAGRRRITTTRAWSVINTPAGWLWLAVVAFVAVSAWWMSQDNRVPIWDAGSHLNIAYLYGTELADGKFWAPFEIYTTYPPLVHLVGAVTYLLVGMHPIVMMMASNIVFVPLLAFGCYGTASIVAGPRAGLLAGLFALGSPMVPSMFHSFMVDTPQAAMVAVSIWAILASRRFERAGVSVGAGALCGLAMLTKETSVVFLAGILAAVFLRGGWRNWRGVLGLAIALGVVAGPWYVNHWSQMIGTFTSIGQLYVNPLQSPPRWSVRSFGWYSWNLVNQQVGLPLAVAFLVGAGVAIIRSVRDRLSTGSVLPDLLVGGLVSYLGVTYLTHKDPRYSLPALVYVAVLGTFWLPGIRRPGVRIAVTSLVVGFAVINFVGMSFGIGDNARVAISFPGAQNNFLYTWKLTLYQDQGWLRGGPGHDADVPALIRRFKNTGVTQVGVDPVTADGIDFSMHGIQPYGDMMGISVSTASTQTRTSLFMFVHVPRPGDPAPCQRLTGGGGIYAVRGPTAGLDTTTLRDPADPDVQYAFVCPGRTLTMWPPAAR
jgi:hypothetical protein